MLVFSTCFLRKNILSGVVFFIRILKEHFDRTFLPIECKVLRYRFLSKPFGQIKNLFNKQFFFCPSCFCCLPSQSPRTPSALVFNLSVPLDFTIFYLGSINGVQGTEEKWCFRARYLECFLLVLWNFRKLEWLLKIYISCEEGSPGEQFTSPVI